MTDDEGIGFTSLSEAANLGHAPMSLGTARRLCVGVALFTSVVIPFLGYGTLLASHSPEGPPRWVYVAIPAAFAGPDIPSLAQFCGLAAVNVLMWFFIAYWIGRLVRQLHCPVFLSLYMCRALLMLAAFIAAPVLSASERQISRSDLPSAARKGDRLAQRRHDVFPRG
jgi:hypothetical protein